MHPKDPPRRNEQAAITHLLANSPDAEHNMARFFFEGAFCISCYWKGQNLRSPTAYIVSASGMGPLGLGFFVQD
jgi:hypothetical protein